MLEVWLLFLISRRKISPVELIQPDPIQKLETFEVGKTLTVLIIDH
jgi:hypothetical protein